MQALLQNLYDETTAILATAAALKEWKEESKEAVPVKRLADEARRISFRLKLLFGRSDDHNGIPQRVINFVIRNEMGPSENSVPRRKESSSVAEL